MRTADELQLQRKKLLWAKNNEVCSSIREEAKLELRGFDRAVSIFAGEMKEKELSEDAKHIAREVGRAIKWLSFFMFIGLMSIAGSV